MRPEFIPIWIEQNDSGDTLAFALSTSCATGCGPTIEAAVGSLRRDISGTRKWLTTHGVADDGALNYPFRIVEFVETNSNLKQGKSKAFFDWDAQRLSIEEINHAEKIMQCSRADLLSLVTPGARETLDLRLAPKTRTIREILRHIGVVELGYATCALDDSMSGPSIYEFGSDLISRLTLVRGYFTDQCFQIKGLL